MASRPGFARKDTDHHSNIHMEDIENASSGSKAYESSQVNPKDESYIDIHESRSQSPGNSSGGEDAGDGFKKVVAAETAKDLVTQVLHVEDDPSLNPYTFRLFFLGSGLSIFAAVLQEIFYFKPQVIYVSVVFLTVISYVLGELMALLIPRWGVLKYLNPGPFNQKEHAAITIMASAAAQAATSTEALAAQELFYGGYPSKVAGIFLTMSSQLIGFGIAGLLRDVLVYPTKMIWPQTLPIATLFETLHRDRHETKRRLKVFFIVFVCFFVWEAFPEYIFTVLTGVSIFCLADQNNLVFTNIFGGASGNEGLGVLNFSLDWNYIAGLWSPLWMPLQTSVNQLIGICLCYILFTSVYYGNIWKSQDFPFLSQFLFNETSNFTNYAVYNQSLILNDQLEIDFDALHREGIPYLTGSYIVYLLVSNMGMTAGIVHMFLWNYDDLKSAWVWARPSNLKKMLNPESWKFWKNVETPEERLQRKENDPELDPHYKVMLRNKYKECPQYWWGMVLLSSWVVGLACIYALKSTLPWWGFIIATLVTFLWVLFFGAMMGITGFQFNTQPIAQMLAGYMFPGRPLANFYFTCYTYNSTQQAQLLAKDVKLAQYAHLPPRCTFVVQCAGCLIGAIFNWVMMISLVQNQAPILKSIQGTNIWSGQNIQQFNTLAIAWAIAKDMFSVGARYQWVPLAFLVGFAAPLPFWIAYRVTGWKSFSYLNTCVILWYAGNLFVGINAGTTTFFVIAFISQYWLRKKHPQFFVKWNYLFSAGADGGTQILLFIFTFAVFGGSGKAVPFPFWAGTPDPAVHNVDYCMVNPANQG